MLSNYICLHLVQYQIQLTQFFQRFTLLISFRIMLKPLKSSILIMKSLCDLNSFKTYPIDF